jgi:hypothetical protein
MISKLLLAALVVVGSQAFAWSVDVSGDYNCLNTIEGRSYDGKIEVRDGALIYSGLPTYGIDVSEGLKFENKVVTIETPETFTQTRSQFSDTEQQRSVFFSRIEKDFNKGTDFTVAQTSTLIEKGRLFYAIMIQGKNSGKDLTTDITFDCTLK